MTPYSGYAGMAAIEVHTECIDVPRSTNGVLEQSLLCGVALVAHHPRTVSTELVVRSIDSVYVALLW